MFYAANNQGIQIHESHEFPMYDYFIQYSGMRVMDLDMVK